jgi:two-component system sensor histidine kinase VicK
MDEAEETVDVYADFRGPNIVDDMEGGIGLYRAAQKRGVKIRVITEITKENLLFCKDNMKYIEGLRHMDTITHMFEVSEKHYGSAKMLAENPHLLEGVFCTIEWFVKAQQYLFESLWRKAIPAKQRFKEIEEGSKREFIETIRDPMEIIDLIPQVLSSTYEELSILFPTIETFMRFESDGLFEPVKHQVDKFNIHVKILVRGDNYEYNEIKPDTGFESLKEYQQNMELQFVNELDTSMLTIIGDRDKLLTIEIHHDTGKKMIESLGLATYSNSEPTIMSHNSIFETSWIQSQIRRK